MDKSVRSGQPLLRMPDKFSFRGQFMLRVWLGVNGESKLGLAATLRLASPGSVTVRSNNLCCSVVIASQIALQSVPLGAPGRFQPRRVRCDPGAKEGSSTGS